MQIRLKSLANHQNKYQVSFINFVFFSTSDSSSDVLLLTKVRDLDIFGSGPDP